MKQPNDFSLYISNLKFTRQIKNNTIPRLVESYKAKKKTRELLGFPANRINNQIEQNQDDIHTRYKQQVKICAARAITKELAARKIPEEPIDTTYAYATRFGFGNCGEHANVLFHNLCETFPNGTRVKNGCDIHIMEYSDDDHAFNKLQFLKDEETIIIDSWADGHPVLEKHYHKLKSDMISAYKIRNYKRKRVKKCKKIAQNEYKINKFTKKFDEKYQEFLKEGGEYQKFLKEDDKYKKKLALEKASSKFFFYQLPFHTLSNDAIENDLEKRENEVVDHLRKKEGIDLSSFDDDSLKQKFIVMRDAVALQIEKDYETE
jgi:hypothetical protein